MFKYILALSLVFIFATKAEAQAITQTWIDPCTGEAQTATFVVGMGAITITTLKYLVTWGLGAFCFRPPRRHFSKTGGKI